MFGREVVGRDVVGKGEELRGRRMCVESGIGVWGWEVEVIV